MEAFLRNANLTLVSETARSVKSRWHKAVDILIARNTSTRRLSLDTDQKVSAEIYLYKVAG